MLGTALALRISGAPKDPPVLVSTRVARMVALSGVLVPRPRRNLTTLMPLKHRVVRRVVRRTNIMLTEKPGTTK